MSSLIYFQLILVFFLRVAPLVIIFPPRLTLNSSAILTKLTINLCIQPSRYSYSRIFVAICSSFS